MGAEEEAEKSRGFKVEDKRRFSSEGALKPEYSSEEQEPPRDASGIPGGEAGTRPEGQSDARASGSNPAPGRESTSAADITFGTFMVGLSTQALIMLGEISDPASPQATTDLAGAQQIIDILGVLKEKTRGNLEADEQGMLDGILYDLRLKYVEKVRQFGG